jgi:hypothetical protein
MTSSKQATFVNKFISDFLNFTRVRVIVFDATFSNISVILWRPVLLVEETGVPGENQHLQQVTDKLYHIMLY